MIVWNILLIRLDVGFTGSFSITIVAPDQFVPSDVCLSGCCRGISLVAMGFPAVWGGKGLRGHVLEELFLSFCRKQSCLRLMIHIGNKFI